MEVTRPPVYQARLERERAAEAEARAEFPGSTLEELYAIVRSKSKVSRGRFKAQLRKMVRDGFVTVEFGTGKALYKLTEEGRKRGMD